MITVDLKTMTIDDFRRAVSEKSAIQVRNEGGTLFQHPETSEGIGKNCLLVDMQSANLICTLHDQLKKENQDRFNVILNDEYKFASFINDMWKWVR